jgi:hypothetical protein
MTPHDHEAAQRDRLTGALGTVAASILDNPDRRHEPDGVVDPALVGDSHEALTFHALPGGIGDVHSNAKGSGARFNAGKPPYDLVPLRILASSLPAHGFTKAQGAALDALMQIGSYQERSEGVDALYGALFALGMEGWEECARVFDYGRAKYAAWNWSKGMAWSVPLACAARHLLAIIRGEAIDPESGHPHRGHVFCNLVMLITFAETYPEGDDLPKAGMLV